MNSLLSEQILPLSVPEKLQLIEDIWDSLDGEQIPLTQSQKQELDRRLISYQNIENQGESWDLVKQIILNNDLSTL
jgi:putative addiction module component (TIGR02574 family)